MKKILSLVLIGILCLTLVGCGTKNDDCSKIKDDEEREACLLLKNKDKKKTEDENEGKNNPQKDENNKPKEGIKTISGVYLDKPNIETAEIQFNFMGDGRWSAQWWGNVADGYYHIEGTYVYEDNKITLKITGNDTFPAGEQEATISADEETLTLGSGFIGIGGASLKRYHE